MLLCKLLNAKLKGDALLHGGSGMCDYSVRETFLPQLCVYVAPITIVSRHLCECVMPTQTLYPQAKPMESICQTELFNSKHKNKSPCVAFFFFFYLFVLNYSMKITA